jgi:hypothetical protein
VQKGFESLLNSKSRLNKKNVISAAAGHMSRLQMLSKEEMHSLQQNLPLTTRLRASGANVCHALNANPRKKGSVIIRTASGECFSYYFGIATL